MNRFVRVKLARRFSCWRQLAITHLIQYNYIIWVCPPSTVENESYSMPCRLGISSVLCDHVYARHFCLMILTSRTTMISWRAPYTLSTEDHILRVKFNRMIDVLVCGLCTDVNNAVNVKMKSWICPFWQSSQDRPSSGKMGQDKAGGGRQF